MDHHEGPDVSGTESDRPEQAREKSPLEVDPERGSTTAASTNPLPDGPPDGGLEAWLQVLGSTAILVNTWGLVNTFGVFQAYYKTELLSSSSASAISWIGSLQGSLLFLAGVPSGLLYDAGYFRQLVCGGLFLIVFGLFMTSLCTVYWQILLAQGFCMGIGMGLIFLPSAAILSQYFKRHLALAMGIASVGSPVAGTVFPIIFSKVREVAGFGWATRSLAFITLAVSVVPVVFMHTRLPAPGKARAIVDKDGLRDLPYMSFMTGGFFAFLTLYVPFFYIPLFATSKGIASEGFAPYLVTLVNAGSVIGRLVPTALADRFGVLNLMAFCMFGSAILVFGWAGVHDLGGAVAYTLIYGAFSGGVVALAPSVIVGLSNDKSRIGGRMSMSFLLNGISLLVGPPIAGAILGGTSTPNWLGTILYSGSGLLVAVMFSILAWVLAFRKTGGWRR